MLTGPTRPTRRPGIGRSRPKSCKLAQNRTLARIVAEKLRLLWSPEQIAGWLKHTYPDDETLHVSHETIYRSLFIQARGALKKELLQHFRRTRACAARGITPRKRRSRADRRCRIDQRAPGQGRRPGGARSLGRGPALR